MKNWIFAAPLLVMLLAGLAIPQEQAGYLICVSNERSGDVTLIDGATAKTVATIPVGKRPRGIHASPDGQWLYVALSGTPIGAPPKLDAKGNPIFEDNDDEGDRTADGISVVSLPHR